MYDNLSDFISKTQVATADGKSIIIVEKIPDQPSITLIGFSTDINKTEYQVMEEGYDYYLRLMEALKQLI